MIQERVNPKQIKLFPYNWKSIDSLHAALPPDFSYKWDDKNINNNFKYTKYY
jgi:hypothetical protein